MTQTILVTGATGAIGPRVVQTLNQSGFRLRTFSVDQPPAGMFPLGVTVLTGDVTDQVAVQSAMQGADAVVHMAALLHIANPSQGICDQYERVNVGGTATVIDAAINAGVRRAVFFSTIAVYGPSTGRVLTEKSVPNPKTPYEQTKLRAERIVLEAKNISGQPMGTVLRLASVYGSRVKGNYRQLLKALAKGRFIPIGPGRNRRTLVYDRDAAHSAVLALKHPDAGGKIFNVSDGAFHPLNDIIATMCKALDTALPRLSLPARPVRFAAGIVEHAARLLGYPAPIMRSTIDKYTEDTAVDSRRIQKELGFVPRFNLAAGWEETVNEMRQSGAL